MKTTKKGGRGEKSAHAGKWRGRNVRLEVTGVRLGEEGNRATLLSSTTGST